MDDAALVAEGISVFVAKVSEDEEFFKSSHTLSRFERELAKVG